jgi:hypothetical protein
MPLGDFVSKDTVKTTTAMTPVIAPVNVGERWVLHSNDDKLIGADP